MDIRNTWKNVDGREACGQSHTRNLKSGTEMYLINVMHYNEKSLMKLTRIIQSNKLSTLEKSPTTHEIIMLITVSVRSTLF